MKNHLTLRGRKLPFSFLIEKKTLWIGLILTVLTLVSLVLSAGLGEMKIHPLDSLKAVLGIGDPRDELVIMNFRLPRIIIAMLVGAALAVAGAILQGVIRNPLASPDIIGITGGASVAAVAFLTWLEGVSIHFLPVAAMIGAAAAAVLIYFLSWKQGITPLRLVLIGVGISAAMSAMTTLMIVTSPIYLTSKAVIWLTGSVYGSNWTHVWTLLPWLLVLLPITYTMARHINIQQLGDDVAVGAGHAIERYRLLFLLLCVGLAGAAVAVGGAISFVGLLAPHIARKLVGSSFGSVLPIAGLIGALIVMLADLVARTAFSPLDLPVGIFTSAIGAPFFIYLLYRNRNN
jgi:iron complex transport system permease protein